MYAIYCSNYDNAEQVVLKLKKRKDVEGQILVCVIYLIYMYMCMFAWAFFISSCGAPLAQRAFYLGLYSSLFEPDGVVSVYCH